MLRFGQLFRRKRVVGQVAVDRRGVHLLLSSNVGRMLRRRFRRASREVGTQRHDKAKQQSKLTKAHRGSLSVGGMSVPQIHSFCNFPNSHGTHGHHAPGFRYTQHQ